jgi:hypothetical protein
MDTTKTTLGTIKETTSMLNDREVERAYRTACRDAGVDVGFTAKVKIAVCRILACAPHELQAYLDAQGDEGPLWM